MKYGLIAPILLASVLPILASGVQDLTNADATGGVKDALLQGATNAVGKLGKADGFLKNPKVKIPLPDSLAKVEGLLRKVGMEKEADELVVSMNRAAETAVIEAKPLLRDAVKQMTIEDAKTILTGGDRAATQYFRKKTEAPLRKKFLPIVKKSTGKVALAEKYDALAGKASELHLVKEEDASIEEYVTRKALDGLFRTIGDEEQAIRKDPAGQASSLIKKVFGALTGK